MIYKRSRQKITPFEAARWRQGPTFAKCLPVVISTSSFKSVCPGLTLRLLLRTSSQRCSHEDQEQNRAEQVISTHCSARDAKTQIKPQTRP